jgi:heptosyltransferase-2
MSLPCLDAALATGIPVVVCARGWARDLLAAYPLAGFIEMSGQWRTDRARVSDYRKQARHVHARGLLLPDSLSSAMVLRFAGVPSAGYRDDGRSLILRWPVRKPQPRPHAVQSWYYLTEHALKRWGLPCAHLPPGRRLNLHLLPRHHDEARQALDDAGLEPGNFILVAPTATGLHRGKIKVWPHFNALITNLQDRGIRVAMCPPPNERQEALDTAPTAQCLAPLKLGAFAALAHMASIVVCNDSGVSHIAAATGVRQVTLFGVTERERTGPWSDHALCLGQAGRWPAFEDVRDNVLGLLAGTA